MSIWQEIKEKISVSSLISEYIPIKPQGANFVCLCPFHQENTPSLVISDQKKVWHCFGCGAGGDIFTFVSLYENINKNEALKKLANKAGLSLDKNFKIKNQEKQENTENSYTRGLQVLAWAAELYHQVLLEILKKEPKHPVSQYCEQRGLNLKTIEEFKIGFAPPEKFLKKIAEQKKIDLELLLAVGLLKKL